MAAVCLKFTDNPAIGFKLAIFANRITDLPAIALLLSLKLWQPKSEGGLAISESVKIIMR
jgi:hypothetical protein